MSTIKRSPVLYSEKGDVWFRDEPNVNLALCKEQMRRVFKLPEEVTCIQLLAYRSPGPNRVSIQMDECDLACVSGITLEITPNSYDYLIRRLGSDVWYVKCHYWEADG